MSKLVTVVGLITKNLQRIVTLTSIELYKEHGVKLPDLVVSTIKSF